MMLESYTIAILVGMMWALAPILAIDLVRRHGAIKTNTIRVIYAAVFFTLAHFAFADWATITQPMIIDAVLSGLIGIFIGDFLLYIGLELLGPRRNSLIFSSYVLFSIAFGVLLLDEQYSLPIWGGVLLMIFGIAIVILYAPSRSGRTEVGQLVGNDDVLGKLWIGVSITLMAALCQAYGSYILRPHIVNAADINALNIIRLCSVAVLCLPVLGWFIARGHFPWRDSLKIGLIGFLGIGIGGYLLYYALKTGELGIVNLLSATSPLWVLPILWFKTGIRPHWIAWFGAALGCVGMAAIFVPELFS